MAKRKSLPPKPFVPDVCHLCGRILATDFAALEGGDGDDFEAPAASSFAGICVHCERSLSSAREPLSSIPDLPAFVRGPRARVIASLVVMESQREVRLPAISVIDVGRQDESRNIYPHVDLTVDGAAVLGVSRKHARIHQTDTGTYIEDLGSTNGTFINGLKLFPLRLYRLDHGDMLRLGQLLLAVKLTLPP
jgi:hypothetical protein